MTQLIIPNPNIPCRPGWCLQYVRETFGLPARYASATEAWEKSPARHYGRDFPQGHWVPVHYAVAGEPLGHIVLLAPDGSVYSTSDNSTIPHHHPDLHDLETFYAGWGWPLTYRGWTEDVSGYPVLIAPDGLSVMGTTITPLYEEQDDMFTEQDRAVINAGRIEAETARKEATNAKNAALDAARVADVARSEATNAKVAAREAVTKLAGLIVTAGGDAAQAKDIVDEMARRLAGDEAAR